MNKESSIIYFALITNNRGKIKKILRDDQGYLRDKFTTLEACVEDKEKLVHFYREIVCHGAAINWEIKLKEMSVPCRFFGGKINDQIVLVCSADNIDLLYFIQELTGMNSFFTDFIRQRLKLFSITKPDKKEYLNPFYEINNELVTLHRNLVEKDEALTRLTNQLDTVFKNAGLGFVFFKNNGTIDLFNDIGKAFMERMTHASLKQGMNIKELFHDDHQIVFKEILLKSFKGDFTTQDISCDGWYEIRTTPINNEAGKQEGFLLITNDINRRKAYEKIIEDQKEYLYLMNRILRHDLSNIFMIAKSATSLYRRTSNEEMLDSIVEASNRGIQIIERIKNAEKILYNPEDLYPISLREAIQKVMMDYKMIKFTCRGDGIIYADDLLYSLINNLVSNAIRHGKATEMLFEISTEKKGVIFNVANNGKPIPNSIKDKIFEEHFKFGETIQGGLGLFIVKKTVERYGGHVHVDSYGEWQTCFRFMFPQKNRTESPEF